MVKNMHFCTKNLVRELKDVGYEYITTFRTGWILEIYVGDIINLNHRIDKKDTFICKGKILEVEPVKYKIVKDYFKANIEEVKRYNKKFHPEHYFFRIYIEKILNEEYTNKEKGN